MKLANNARKLVVSLLTVGGKIEEKLVEERRVFFHGRDANSRSWVILLE